MAGWNLHNTKVAAADTRVPWLNCSHYIPFPIPETNSKFAAENGWLEDDPSLPFSFWDSAYFQGGLRAVAFPSISFWLAKSCITLPCDRTKARRNSEIESGTWCQPVCHLTIHESRVT